MNSAFDDDNSWFYDAKKQLKSDLDLGLIDKEQYEKSINMLWNEKQEDSFY